MVPTRNTRHRFSLALMVSLLFCGLSAIEFPEFFQLVDDTSNDFTVLVSADTSATTSVVADEKCAPDQSADRNTPTPVGRSVQFPIRTTPAQSPDGYRHLICIYRT
jgi:hypothetical protein